MNRRKFLQWFGIGLPAAAVAAVVAPKLLTKVPQGESYKEFSARLGEWHNFYHEGDPEITEAIETWKPHPYHLYFDPELVAAMKRENNALYTSLASRNALHVRTPVKRQFFTYNVGKS